jgi:hypothetical protein
MVCLIIISFFIDLDVFSNNSLFKVPFVASIPIVFVFVFNAAGLIAGSIPINETG